MQASMHDTEMRKAVIERYNEDEPDHFETLDVHGKSENRMIFYLRGTEAVEMLQSALAKSSFAPQVVQLAAWDQALARFKAQRPGIAARMP